MFHQRLNEHIHCMKGLAHLEETIVHTADLILSCLRRKGGLFIAGNGGSAADAQHFAAELVGRFQRDREPYSATALTTDTAILTALANDYGYEQVFSRQILGLARKDDIFIGVSTSGTSSNIIQAVKTARELGLWTVGLLGREGGGVVDEVDSAIVVRDSVTARIQEAHAFILHFWAEYIETRLSSDPEAAL